MAALIHCSAWSIPSQSRKHPNADRARASSRASVVCASAGRGFGAKREKSKPSAKDAAPKRREDETAVSKILKKLEEEKAATPNDKEDDYHDDLAASRKGLIDTVNPKTAAKGRVDYVRVQDWQPRGKADAQGGDVDIASIDDADLGNLAVRSFSQGAAVSPGKRKSSPSPASSSPPESDEPRGDRGSQGSSPDGGLVEETGPSEGPLGVPFYEQLVRHLQLLDSRGELAVARPKSAGALPPFERWSFGDDRFLQYLVDLRCVHSALEEAIGLMALEESIGLMAAPPPTETETPPLPPPPPPQETSNSNESSAPSSVYSLFGPGLGLSRSTVLDRDIKAMLQEMAPPASDKAMGKAGGAHPSSPARSAQPGTQAAAHAAYISRIARAFLQDSPLETTANNPIASAKSSRGGRDSSTVSGSRAVRRAELRVFANLYAVYIANLTTGMRIGAKAMECVPSMRRARAVGFFRDYPATVKDPLQVFIAAVDRLGLSLDEEEKNDVLEELPKAVVKASLLLSVLAVEGVSSTR